jgi:hypothetical protein
VGLGQPAAWQMPFLQKTLPKDLSPNGPPPSRGPVPPHGPLPQWPPQKSLPQSPPVMSRPLTVVGSSVSVWNRDTWEVASIRPVLATGPEEFFFGGGGGGRRGRGHGGCVGGGWEGASNWCAGAGRAASRGTHAGTPPPLRQRAASTLAHMQAVRCLTGASRATPPARSCARTAARPRRSGARSHGAACAQGRIRWTGSKQPGARLGQEAPMSRKGMRTRPGERLSR